MIADLFDAGRAPLYACTFSEDRVYRYTLTDTWDKDSTPIVFIGLNPSTADEFKLDPTLTRCRRWARNWGHGSFVMLNLFAFRSPHPKVMLAHPEPVGESNDETIIRHLKMAHAPIVCAWGTPGSSDRINSRIEHVRLQIRAYRHGAYCLGTTKDGSPIHPMARGKHRVSDDVKLQPYNP